MKSAFVIGLLSLSLSACGFREPDSLMNEIEIEIPQAIRIEDDSTEVPEYRVGSGGSMISYPFAEIEFYHDRIEAENYRMEFVLSSSQFEEDYRRRTTVREESLRNGLKGKTYLHVGDDGKTISSSKTILFHPDDRYGIELQGFDIEDLETLDRFLELLNEAKVLR